MLTTNFAEAGGFIKSQPGESRARPATALRHRQAGQPWPQDGVRPRLFMPRVPAAAEEPRQRQAGQRRPAAAPLIDPNFLGERDDVERLVRGVKALRKILQQPALAELGAQGTRRPRQARRTMRRSSSSSATMPTPIYHPVGSCRMGQGPMDVVDAELRVHGVQGLRVVDASIMPQRGQRQHQRADDHDRREGGRHDQGRCAARPAASDGGSTRGILAP